MTDEEKSQIEERALQIPCDIVAICCSMSSAMQEFLTLCNPMIISDAQAAIHLFSGSAHAAFHTAMINKPQPALHNTLQDQLAQISEAVQAALRR
ncbi:MAG: cyclodeaminase/cyclohydrolase family protein [Planctomycetes bacterium]|nr:cyclodeaminase/cyclohydrolase family protein [Planctomycetota bacterium]